MSDTIPYTKIQKSKVIGKATLKMGLHTSKSMIKRAFLKPEQKQKAKAENSEKLAEIMMDALGELKGVSVKIAQQIGLNLTFLPTEYIEKLENSFNKIPPLNRAVVRKVIKQEFGFYPNQLFTIFDGEVFAGASLGQVHLAQIYDETVVVKIQYPAIEKSIKSDMQIVKFMLVRVAKSKEIEHLIGEISDRLFEEIDYIQEAKNSNFFRDNLNIKDIIIPKVYNEFSTKKVITSEKIEGVILRDFLATNPSQKLKNHYGNLLFQSFFKSLYRLHKIHADPNPGNYLFCADNKLAMIDFGCVKSIDSQFLKLYSSLHIALIEQKNEEEIIEWYVKLGMIERDTLPKMSAFYKDIINPLDSLYIEPFIEDIFDFKSHKDFSKRGFEAIFEIQKKQINSIDKLNQEFIFLDRTLLGLYAIFEKLGAVIDTSYAKDLMRRINDENI
ncbi:MAG: AarF/ABC1/UbiB kinase family protein [Sulfurovum sp.]